MIMMTRKKRKDGSSIASDATDHSFIHSFIPNKNKAQLESRNDDDDNEVAQDI